MISIVLNFILCYDFLIIILVVQAMANKYILIRKIMDSRINTGRSKMGAIRADYNTIDRNRSFVSTSSNNRVEGLYSSDVLKNFQDELTLINTRLDTKNKAFRLRKEMIRQDKKQKAQIREKLQTIKNKLQIRKKKEDIEKRLERIITQHAESLQKKKQTILPRISQSLTIPPSLHYRNPTQPIYIPSPHLSPYYQPMPFYPHYPTYPTKYNVQSEENEESDDEEIVRPSPRKYRKRPAKVNEKNRYLSKQDRQRNKERLKKIMRKCFRTVAYVCYLKKISKDIKNKRKTLFDKYWPQNFQKSSIAMRKWFSSNCGPFFDQMSKKKDLVINIEGDENDTVMLHKKKQIKGLIKILVQCLNNLVDDASFQQICQIVLLFCKHGAFAQNGVLTPQQAQTVCFSQIHGYLRMDRDMQKSQIINFLFMKIILYNMLLQPWKYSSKFEISQNHQAYQNFFFISSVFYQLMSDIQNQYLKAPRDQVYKIGNFKALKAKFKVKFCPSLIHLENNYQQGQMISGLVSETALDSLFPPSFWRAQNELIIGIIDKMHEKLRKTHWKLINTVYNYKDVSKF